MVIYTETRPDQLGIKKAAIITGVGEGMAVNLHVFQTLEFTTHHGPTFEPVTVVMNVPFDEAGERPGSWSWPPRV